MFSEEKEEHLKEYVEPTASTPSASPANVSNISTAAQSGDVPQDDVDEDGYSIKPKWETQTIKKGELIKYIHIVVFYKLNLFVRDFFKYYFIIHLLWARRKGHNTTETCCFTILDLYWTISGSLLFRYI